jgi:hypothetical protein
MFRNILISLLILFLGCNPPEIERPVTEPDDVIGISTRWTGTLPCADCDGIIYDLELNAETGRFTLNTTYLATKDGDKAALADIPGPTRSYAPCPNLQSQKNASC